MTTPLFHHQPRIGRQLWLLPWVIPGLLTPTALLIFFLEDPDPVRFAALTGFGFGLCFALLVLLSVASRGLAAMTISIGADAVLRVRRRDAEDTLSLRDVDTFSFLERNGFSTLQVKLVTGEIRMIVLPGSLDDKTATALEAELMKHVPERLRPSA
jgi:hypothetical protein